MKSLSLMFIILLLSQISLAFSSDTQSFLSVKNIPPEIVQIRLKTNNIFQTNNQFYVNNPLQVELSVDVNDDNGYEDISFVRFKVIDKNNQSNNILGTDFIYLALSQRFITNSIYTYNLELLPEYNPSTYIVYVEVQDELNLVSSQEEFTIQKRNNIPTGFITKDVFTFRLSGFFSRILNLFS